MKQEKILHSLRRPEKEPFNASLRKGTKIVIQRRQKFNSKVSDQQFYI